MSSGQKAIVFITAFVITIITICAFFKNNIEYIVISKTIEKSYGDTSENSYFLEDNFDYVDNYEKAEINSKTEMINSIYYIINSGVSYSERYCSMDYSDCYNDMDSISSNGELLSLLNNYVHPYNGFKTITFSYTSEVLKISIEHIYTDDEINAINTFVDEFIENNITNNMSTKEKIKIIHDYIINNTDYDSNFDVNSDNNQYRSNTAYGVLIQGYGICSGYSDAMAIFLDKLNIINYKISTNNNNQGHIWNLVYLDGEWLHLDLTWDDPISDTNITRDSYFLVTTNQLTILDDSDTHSFDKSVFTEANS